MAPRTGQQCQPLFVSQGFNRILINRNAKLRDDQSGNPAHRCTQAKIKDKDSSKGELVLISAMTPSSFAQYAPDYLIFGRGAVSELQVQRMWLAM